MHLVLLSRVGRRAGLALLLSVAGGLATASAAERLAQRITLTNGFDLICDHREIAGDRVRLYTDPGGANFVEVASAEIATVESIAVPVEDEVAPSISRTPAAASNAAGPQAKDQLTRAELHEMLASAGAQHHLDVELLNSLVQAESGGRTRAVSKTGARGLMQLMPKTAAQLGVQDSFCPEDNIAGGTAYLDALLTRYHDNLVLALAAYNAGPAAVARWHGIPPYRETRLYVARIVRSFNASIQRARLAAAEHTAVATNDSAPSGLARMEAP